MATSTYDLIDSQVLSSSTTEVTFSSLAAGYRDIIIVCDAIPTSGEALPLAIRFNGDTGTNYPWVRMGGDGSTAYSFASSSVNRIYAYGPNLGTDQRTGFIAQVMDYSATDKHKSVLIRTNAADSDVTAYAGRWANTSAITSITVTGVNTNAMGAGTTIYLYGIAS